MIRADGLTLGYGQREIVSGLTFSYAPGEGPLGLCGPNGSGKSTFLKACLGLVPARSGSLSVFGRRPGRGFSPCLKRMAYLPQQSRAAGRAEGAIRLTVRELASSGREAVRGLFRPLERADRIKVDAALEKAGLSLVANQAVKELSGGQYQRVMIARALAMEPELLLLDEPSAHLDRESRAEIISIIEGVSLDPAVGLLLVSHDPGLLRLCPRLIAFEGGRGNEVPEGERERHVDEERDV
jgi:ABC-type Mn2+/Zn2+ transport system ATPase subunit